MDRDQLLAEIIDTWSARQRRGEVIDMAGVAHAHPDIADELRSLWAAHQLADALARPTIVHTSMPQRTSPTPMPQSFADFEIVRELGRGGMGVVYLARQKSLGRHVALKMVLHGAFASESDRARFRAEAGAAAKLVHPNIVAVFEVGEHDDRPYFAMQYVEGETLAQRVVRGPLPAREAAELVAAIARGIEAAHQQGVIHRDIKPSNVLLQKPEVETTGNPGSSVRLAAHQVIPKITDFGLAKLLGGDGVALTTTGLIVGTPSYMAPEQAAGRKEVGPTTDVYSLGAILYELLTGRPPFQAATHFDTIALVLEQSWCRLEC